MKATSNIQEINEQLCFIQLTAVVMKQSAREITLPEPILNAENRQEQFTFVEQLNPDAIMSLLVKGQLSFTRQLPPQLQRPYQITFRNKQGLEIDYDSELRQSENNCLGNSTSKGDKQDYQSEFLSADKYSRQHLSPSVRCFYPEKDGDLSKRKMELIRTKRLSNLIKKSDSDADFAELDFQLPNVYQSDILLSCGDSEFIADRANICGTDYLQFQRCKIDIISLHKIKVYPDLVKRKSYRLKLTHDDGIFNIGAQLKRELYHLPEHYIWFAKLVNSRLMKLGSKVQLKRSKTSITLHENGIFKQGVVYKCSKYRKKWERRFVLINNEGLYSYKNQKDSYSFSIPAGEMQQLWTNFELFGSHLIIKIRHGGEKTEFAIPVLDYCLKEDAQNWLFSFYRLLMEHKIHIKV